MRSQNQRVLALVIAIVSLATVSAEAQGNWRPGDFGSWRFFMGIFEPEANSQFWDEYFMDFTGSPSSFQDLVFGTDYLWRTTRSGGLLFGASFYEGKSTLAYQDWVDADGQDISHTSSLGLSDLTAAYVLRFGRNSIRPYIGGGGGLLWWRFREEGYFIDFGAEDLPIFFGNYRADGLTWELVALAGLDFRLSHNWSFFFEGRYRWSEDELGDDFSGFGTIDLSGGQMVGGFSYNF
jgi:hypothetical protein